jgi:hypothetical protein
VNCLWFDPSASAVKANCGDGEGSGILSALQSMLVSTVNTEEADRTIAGEDAHCYMSSLANGNTDEVCVGATSRGLLYYKGWDELGYLNEIVAASVTRDDPHLVVPADLPTDVPRIADSPYRSIADLHLPVGLKYSN